MSYLVDGHNLIPKIPGMSLQAIDDEIELIQVLQEFCRSQRKRVEVFFDNAPPGQPAERRYGMVRAVFVRQGKTADQAIRDRLKQLGRSAANWTVVSSDQAVQSAARRARARVLSSEAFANLLRPVYPPVQRGETPRPEVALSPEEVDEWLRLFQAAEEKARKKRGKTGS